MDAVDLYSNQLLPMTHPQVATPTHHSPLPPLSSALSVPNSSTSQGNQKNMSPFFSKNSRSFESNFELSELEIRYSGTFDDFYQSDLRKR